MNAHVLLIDDDETFSNSIKTLFRLQGIGLEHALTWDEGVALFRVGLHELVIADYNLPGSEHGLKLLARVKSLRPSSELVLISGQLTSVPVERIKRSGLVDAYLPKNSELPDRLLELAAEAVKSGMFATEWPSVARAHVAGDQILDKEIDEIDQMLRKSLPEA